VFRNEEHQLNEVIPEQPPPPPMIEQTAPPTSVVDTLDQFSGGFLPPNNGDKQAHAVTEEAEGEQAASGQSSETSARGPAASDAEVDEIKRAYRRGQDDRKAGKKPDDMPDEFADNSKNKQQIAWISGYDSKPLPTFGSKQ